MVEVLIIAARTIAVLFLVFGGCLCLDLLLSDGRRRPPAAEKERETHLRHLRLDA